MTGDIRLPKTVTLIDASQIKLKCNICNQVWSPALVTGGKIHRGGKHCPNGCREK